MFSKTILTSDDLAAMVAAIFAANQRGEVLGVAFYDDKGQPLQLAYCEAITEGPGLRVRSVPEPSPEELVARVSQQTFLDPRAVPGPASMAELEGVLREA